MTDAAGDIVWEATYEAFGKATVDPESVITNNLRFPGQYWDEETGNHYNWNRYYDPGTGRYVSGDSLGFEGGDVNLFRYANNRSIMMVDPFGLYTWTNSDLDAIEAIMSSWEEANTEYAPKTDKKYRGRGATKGVRADCTGSLYAILNEAGFRVPYFPTRELDPTQDSYNESIEKYYNARSSGENPKRGDLVLLKGHLVYYLGKKSRGSHEVYGAHYTGGPDFDRHSYKAGSFKPIAIYYYDGPERLANDKNPLMPSSITSQLSKYCRCISKAFKKVFK